MGLFDAFKKDEVVGTKAVVCALGGAFEDLPKKDEGTYKRFFPTTGLTVTNVAELKQAISQKPDILHLFCTLDAQGAIADTSGARITGTELLQACADAGVRVLWIASDNFAEAYNAGFPSKGAKINIVLTERRLGPNFSLFLDNLLTKLKAGESFSKAWKVASTPEGRSVQPDVPHTITTLGRGNVIFH